MNNSTSPPTQLPVGGQRGGNIKITTNPPLIPAQKAAVADKIASDPTLPADTVQGVVAGQAQSQSPGSQGATFDENHITDTPYAVAVDPDALPNSGRYPAPTVFSPGDIVQEPGAPAYIYYYSNNGDGTITPYVVTAAADDAKPADTIKAKIGSIAGTTGFSSINKGTIQAVCNNEAGLVRGAAAALKKLANQLSATKADNIDESVKQIVNATIERIRATAAYLLTSAAAADAANNI